MKISRSCLLLLLICFAGHTVGAEARPAPSAADTLHMLSTEACILANEFRVEDKIHCNIERLRRMPLTTDVAHYTFEVRVGASKHAVLTLHRIVREQAPFKPAANRTSIFLVQDDRAAFAAAFLTAPASGALRNQLPVYLASHDIDVWGADFRRYLEPTPSSGAADLAPWGRATDIDDLSVALLVARSHRFFTGGGFGTLQLAGVEGGLGTAYLQAEGERLRWLRHVEGFLPLEVLGPPAPGVLRLAARGAGGIGLEAAQ